MMDLVSLCRASNMRRTYESRVADSQTFGLTFQLVTAEWLRKKENIIFKYGADTRHRFVWEW
jgi:hypothetical protein